PSAPAICGTRPGWTKLAASTRGSPASARRRQNSARTAGARVMSSLWSPSRGPTSQIVARGSTSGPVYFQALLPDPGAFALHVANAGLWTESRAVALTDLERHVRRVDEDA